MMDSGDRFNTGKLNWSLIDFNSLEDMVRVLEFGTKKYESDNWRKGLYTRDTCESLMRHLLAYMQGEDADSETKLSHIAHIQANAMFLMYMTKYKPEFDNRYKDVNKLKIKIER